MSIFSTSINQGSYTAGYKIIHTLFFLLVFGCCLLAPYWILGLQPFESTANDKVDSRLPVSRLPVVSEGEVTEPK